MRIYDALSQTNKRQTELRRPFILKKLMDSRRVLSGSLTWRQMSHFQKNNNKQVFLQYTNTGRGQVVEILRWKPILTISQGPGRLINGLARYKIVYGNEIKMEIVMNYVMQYQEILKIIKFFFLYFVEYLRVVKNSLVGQISIYQIT